MEKLLFWDGAEYDADDFTFWSDAIEGGFQDRTKLWAGRGGVWTGGEVTDAGGLDVDISGPFKGHANGDLIQITSPATITLPDNATRYIIATYATDDDTPATYYGAGSPPDRHRNDNPTITASTTPANINSNQIPLATVVTLSGAIDSITDTRVILPSVDNSGNIDLGDGATVDGIDISDHAATIGDGTTAGHLKLGAAGGAAQYEAVGGYWVVDRYVSGRAANFIPDDADFLTPPMGVTVDTFRTSSVDGTFDFHAYGPEYNLRAILYFDSTDTFTVSARIQAYDDTIRVKDSTGSDIFSNGTANQNADQTLTMQVNTGANAWKVYGCNGGGDEMITQLITTILRDPRVTFTPN